MRDELPKSANVGKWEAIGFFVTAGSWDTGYGPSYEIGIRNKLTGEFTLIQGSWTEGQIQLVGRAVTTLLDDGFYPSDIQDVLRG